MEIKISDAAVKFFKDELGVPEGKGIHISGKAYGSTNMHDNFSVAIEVKKPVNPIAMTEKDELMVFAEQSDEWFIADLDLIIDYEPEEEIPTYLFLPDDTEIDIEDIDTTSSATKKN